MNIGFYDPISERWIKPRPERAPEEKPCVSMGEALMVALAAAALKERNDRIWKYLKQAAEGCNRPTVEAEPVSAAHDLQWDGRPIGEQIADMAPLVVEVPPEYVPEFSLGYIYWKPKDAQCSGQQE